MGFGKGKIKGALGDLLNGAGSSLTNGINKHLGNLKIPVIETKNKIELSTEMYIGGGVILFVVLFSGSIKKILKIK